MAVELGRSPLLGTEGFSVDSPGGRIGLVEELWLGPGDEPAALAVRTVAGEHGLLLAEEVAAVNAEVGSVLAAPGARLLELSSPRLEPDGSQPARLTASWETTGDTIGPSPARARPGVVERLTARRRPGRDASTLEDMPLWLPVVILISSIFVLVALVMTLAFVVAWLVAGTPY